MQGTILRGGAWRGVALGLLAFGLLATVVLAGCGGGSSATSTSTTVPGSPAASAQGSGASADAVVSISGTPITQASYEHWLAVEKALGVSSNSSHQTLGFLITADWLLAEAAARKISVSEADVKQRLAQVEKQSFPRAGALQRFLAKSGESEADLLARVKVELLTARIAAQVAAGKSGAQRGAVLASFQRAFHNHWKAYTSCRAGYVMEDCAQYTGKPENLTAASASSSSSASGSGASRAAGASNASGASNGAPGATASSAGSSGSELPPPRPGALAITSPAFAPNGPLPKQYTCDGANISPPLQWQNVPAKAAALVLFVIDDTTNGPASGIRWVVGDISPTSRGVAAGQTPAGGVVGADTQGHAGYGGICPARGQTSTIEFELYALSKRIPLSPGFQPAVAEQEYGAGKLVLGEAAVTYATYRRAG